ncbi:choice-of-anchor D domain-containing protein [candidate division KSB1 bacterium]
MDSTKDIALITIRNTGGDTASVLNGAPTGAFSLVSPVFPQMLEADSAVTYIVRFAPTDTGSFSGTVTFATTDTAHLSLVFEVNGTGTLPNAGSLSFVEMLKDGVGAVDGLNGARNITVSPDGANVYATAYDDDAVAVFSRNPATGVLTYVEMQKDGVGVVDGLDGAIGIAMSPDGANVYATGVTDDAVAVFSRNPATGALTYVEMQKDGVGVVDGLDGALGVTVSPDGAFVYVTGSADNAVAVFSRDPSTGALTYVEMQKDGVGVVDGLAGSFNVTVSPDGAFVYATGYTDDAVAVFSRNPATGALTYVEMQQDGVGVVDGLDEAYGVTVSPDGAFVYVTGYLDNAVAVFSRNPATGALTYVEMQKDGVGGVDGLAGAVSVKVSPDGAFVYATGYLDDAVAVFSRNPATGALTFVEILKDQIGGVDGLASARHVVVSPDGAFVYATGNVDDAVAVFSVNENPKISFTPVTLDFDSVLTGLTDTLFVSVSNDSGGPLNIDSVQAPVEFTVEPSDSAGIAAGDTVEFKVIFTPTADSTYADSIYFYSNDPLNSPFALSVQGVGELSPPNLILVDSVAWFTGTLVDSTKDVAFISIQNTGGDTATVLSGTPTGVFSLVSPVFPQTLEGDSIATFLVRFTPTDTGSFTGTVTFATTDTAHSSLVFTVNGIGTQPNAGGLSYIEHVKDDSNSVNSLQGVEVVIVSPDGKHLYAGADDAVNIFSIDQGTGVLTLLDEITQAEIGGTGLNDVTGIAISPGGEHLYISAKYDHSLTAFSRDPVTGLLTFVTTISNVDIGGIGLYWGERLAISPDGAYIYGIDRSTAAISLFSRDPVTGVPTFIEVVTGASLGGSGADQQPEDIAISPDGKNMYVACRANEDAVFVFSRDQSSGKLTFLEAHTDGGGGITGLYDAVGVTVSHDGRHVYATGKADNAVVIFERNTSDGTLTFVNELFDTDPGVDGLAAAIEITMSPDDRYVYVTSEVDDGVAVFQRDISSGDLTFLEVENEGSYYLDGCESIAITPDGRFAYAASSMTHILGCFEVNELPKISITPVTLDFDSVLTGTSDTLSVSVWNAGGDSLHIDSTYISMTEFTIEPVDTTGILAGDSVQFKVIFSPTADSTYADSIYFYSNDPLNSPFALSVQGIGYQLIPLISVSTDSLDFDSVYVSMPDTLSLWVYSDSTGALDIDSVVSSPEFVVEPFDTLGIPPGDSVLFSVIFTPTADSTYMDSLLFYSNDPVNSPSALNVQGTGVILAPNVIFVDSVAWFGGVLVDSTRDIAFVTIRNTGNDTASVTGVTPASVFSVVESGFPYLIDPDSAMTFTVRFSPTAETDYNGTLTFATTDPNNLSLVFEVNGIGTVPKAGTLSFVEFKQDGVDVNELLQAYNVAISPDGAHVYTTSHGDDAVSVFSRNSTTGMLTYEDVYVDGSGGVDGMMDPHGIEVSPDGANVYVAGSGDNAIAVFSRDQATGLLTFMNFHVDGSGGVSGMLEAQDLAISPDGGFIYVTGITSNAIAVFKRNSVTGALEFVEAQVDGGANDGLLGAWGVTVSPDGKHVYVTARDEHKVSVFARNQSTGALTFIEVHENGIGGVNGISDVLDVTVSKDGANVYTASYTQHTIAIFDRNSSDGSLTFLEYVKDDSAGVNGLNTVNYLSFSPDNEFLYANGSMDDMVAIFKRNSSSGLLTFIDYVENDSAGVDGLDEVREVIISPDGAHAYTVSFLDNALGVFAVEDFSPAIALDPVTLDFDSIAIGTSDSLTVWVRNDGTADLDVDSVAVPAEFSIDPASYSGIIPGDSTDFLVIFNPAADSTYIDSLLFYSNDTTNNPIALDVNGTGYQLVPLIGISTDSLDFNSVLVGMPDTLSLWVYSDSTGALDIDSVASSQEFAVEPANYAGLSAGDSVQFSVIFTPTADSTYIDSLLFFSNDTLNSPLPIQVQGIGYELFPLISVSTDSLDFDSVYVGLSDTLSLWVYNDSTGALDIDSIAMPSGFSVEPASYSGLSFGDSVLFSVIFTPASASTYIDSLLFYNNDTSNSPIVVDVLGEGIIVTQPQITLDPGSLNFGTVTVGSSGQLTVLAINSGTAALNITGVSAPSGFSSDPTSESNIAPGDTAEFTITFSPVSATAYSDSVIFTSNDPAAPAKALPVQGVGQPVTQPNIIVTTASYNFNSVLIGSQASTIVFAKNTGNADLSISNVTAPSGFSVSPTSASNIAPGDSAAFTVTFSPTSAISYSGSVVFTSNDPDDSPLSMSIQGFGEQPAHPIITLTQSMLSFESVQVDSSVALTFAAVNSGTATLNITDITAPYAFDATASVGSVAPGDSAMVNVIFTPDSIGYFSGIVQIHSSDPDSSVVSVNVSGYGIDQIPPEFIDEIYVVPVDTETVIITWQTTELTTGRVAYQPGSLLTAPEYLYDSTFAYNHQLTLTGLIPDTVYTFRIEANDRAMNETLSQLYQFITPERPDFSPPVFMTQPSAFEQDTTSVRIDFTLDEPARYELFYNTDSLFSLGDYITIADSAYRTSNNLNITGLTPLTSYQLFVRVYDAIGNGPTQSVILRFQTLGKPDVTPPYIKPFPVAQVLDTSMVQISWTTDELSDSWVFYRVAGESTAFDSTGINDQKIYHTITLDNLETGTEYEYYVASTDVKGNGPTHSSVQTFITHSAPDNQAPIISSVNYKDRGINSVTIIWATNEPATSMVEVFKDSVSGVESEVFEDSLLVIAHQIGLSSLEANTTYWYRVGSIDASGNGPVYSSYYSVKTRAKPDIEPPVIVGFPEATDVDTNSAVITWITDETSNSLVEYAVDTLWNAGNRSFILDQDGVTVHTVTLTGLLPGMKYRYRVASTDAGGNGPTYSIEQTFTTTLIPDVIPPILVGFPSITSTDTSKATLVWKTNELTIGTVTLLSQDPIPVTRYFLDYNLTREHRITLHGLTPGMVYSGFITSTDRAGNKRVHSNKTFVFETVRSPDTHPPVFAGFPEVTGVDIYSATVVVSTDEETELTIEYAPDAYFADPDSVVTIRDTQLLNTHRIQLSNLMANTMYSFRAIAIDAAGNGPVTSAVFNFKTKLVPDITPPHIIGFPVVSSIDTGSATVYFSTDEESSTEIALWASLDSTNVMSFTRFDLVKQHEMYIGNLMIDTEYTGYVQTIDEKGNGPTRSGRFTFRTLSVPDTDPPILIGIPELVNVDTSSATLRYVTNEEGTTILRLHRLSDPADSIIFRDNEIVLEHFVFLPNLLQGEEYSYDVGSVDEKGNGPVFSDLFNFETPEVPDTDPPVIFGLPTERNLDTASVTIIWRTDETSNSKVDVWSVIDSSDIITYQDGKLIDIHEVFISGLLPGHEYAYMVFSTDAKNNGPTISPVKSFQTPVAPDVSAPRITSGPTVYGITHKSAHIKIKTSETAFVSVDYGKDQILDNSKVISAGKTTHVLPLTNLEDSTKYYYRLKGSDIKGNSFVFPDSTVELPWFETAVKPATADTTKPVVVQGPVELNIEPDKFTVFWRTDRPANSTVDYGTGQDLGFSTSKDNNVLVYDHSVDLTNLGADTTYYYRIKSTGANNKKYRSPVYTITTPAVSDTFTPVITEGPLIAWLGNDNVTIEWKTDKSASSRINYSNDPDNLVLFASDNEVNNVEFHQIRLIDLMEDTLYYYRVSSIAGNGKETASTIFNFSTPAAPDTVAPKILTGPSATSIEQTSVTIEWGTDELSTSIIEYGPAFSNSIMYTKTIWIDADASGVRDHEATLTGLVPGQAYDYRVTSIDLSSFQNTIVSRNKSFTTIVKADTVKPKLISGPIVVPYDNFAIFEWETDEASDSFVYIRLLGSSDNFRKVGLSQKVRNHVVRVNNLVNGEQYEYEIASRDLAGNLFTWPTAALSNSISATLSLRKVSQPPGGGGSFFTDENPDTQPPIIIEGPTVAAKTANTITVQWKTDERSDSFIDYGLNESYGSNQGDAVDVTDHSLTLTNLDTGTLYNFRVSSTDPNNIGPTLSLNSVVTTEAESDVTPPKITAGPVVEASTDDQATITWETDEHSDTYVEFGETDSYGEVRVITTDTKVHVMTLTNLSASTTYHYRIGSTDISDNGPTLSDDLTFATPAGPDDTPPVISNVDVPTKTDSIATITFDTDELGDTFVNFGLTDALGLAVGSTQDVTAHEITLTNLTPNSTYHYQVGSINKTGLETLHTIDTFVTAAESDTDAPAAPSGVDATAGDEQVLVRWNASAEEDLAGYNISRDAGGGFVTIATLVADTFYYDSGLANGITYQYKLTAVDASDNISSESSADGDTPDPANAPAVPEPEFPIDDRPTNPSDINPKVTNSETRHADRQELVYEFVIAEESDFFNQVGSGDNVAEGDGSTAWNSGLTLTDGATYYWKARAFDGLFYSDWTATQSFIIDALVVGVELIGFWANDEEGRVVLGWETASESDAAGYNLYRSRSRENGFERITEKMIDAGRTDYRFVDDGVRVGLCYFYKLEFVSGSGHGLEFEPVEILVSAPRTYRLHENYPNPFNPETTIKFELPKQDRVRLIIYNVLGQQVKALLDTEKEAGFHDITWDGTDDFGRLAASGVYFYRIASGSFVQTKKMLLIK